jgi:hypothetical protein
MRIILKWMQGILCNDAVGRLGLELKKKKVSFEDGDKYLEAQKMWRIS